MREARFVVYTGESKSYFSVDDTWDHQSVSHNYDRWVVGGVRTNSIKDLWLPFKRSLMGPLHMVSIKHIDQYLSELEWRFNNRDTPRIFIDTLRRIVATKAMPYAELMAAEDAA